MGLLDSLFGGMERSSKLTNPEAFAGILLGASACDGHIADDEVQGLVTTLVRMKLYQRFNDKQYGDMLKRLHAIIKKKGVDALIDLCVAGIDSELRETAFANACDIVLADGVVEADEKEFVETLGKKLDIEKKLAVLIVKIMVVKNKG